MSDRTMSPPLTDTVTTNGVPGANLPSLGATPNGYQTLADMRPTLIVGAGGTGQQIATFLKASLQERFGAAAWRTKVKLLAFDTADEAFTLTTSHDEVRLEPGAEFFNIGNVPVPSIIHNIEGLEAIRERLGSIIPSLPPVVLRSGAKQLRPFGLLSLLWNYKTVSEELRRAIWVLAGRDQAHMAPQGQGINIFICGSLVGGTGSGTFLDLAHLIRAFFGELGSQAEFCHITGIGVLPQAFFGISGPNLYPNTAAALQELNHLMVKTGFRTRYPDGRVIASREAPFNLFYLIDGVDERGQTWSGIAPICAMIAEGIYLQMGSQLGRKGENAFDNLNESLTGQTASGEGTFFSSFGLGYLLFDAPAVAEFCARRFLHQLLRNNWLGPREGGKTVPPPQALLTQEKLQARLCHDPATDSEIKIDLTLPGWLLQKRPDEIASEAIRYTRSYGQARVTEMFLPRMNQNADLILAEQVALWQAWVRDHLLSPETGVPAAIATLEQNENLLGEWLDASQKKVTEINRRLERQTEAVAHLETALARATSSFPLGRSGRVKTALTSYFQAIQEMFDNQLRLHLLNCQRHVWSGMVMLLQGYRADAMTLQQRLTHLAERLGDVLPHEARRLSEGGISHLSLADESYLNELYGRYQPTWADIKQQMGDPLPLCRLTTSALEQYCLKVLAPNFSAIQRKTIEEVLQERSAEMTPRARRQQLFRLATPSWNVNRARLPEGGLVWCGSRC